jgi:hypothetical protein
LDQLLFHVPLDLDLAGASRLGPMVQSRRHPLRDQPLSHALDRPQADPEGADDVGIGSLVSL